MAAHVKEKGVADYVTQVDVAVQDFLKKALYKLAPDIQFLGEETGLQRMDTDSYWILDPVDNTRPSSLRLLKKFTPPMQIVSYPLLARLCTKVASVNG